MSITNKSILVKFAAFVFTVIPVALQAQETTAEAPAKPVKEYVKATFENGVVLNSQTVENPRKKSLDFMIQHRFGVIKDETDLFGIYAPANIRLGLSYGITSRLAVGLGVTKNKMMYDLNGKYTILKQTKQKGIPVTLAYYGSVARSTTSKDNFLNAEGEFKEAYKFSYFHKLMVARKLNNKISLQLGGTYSHFNIIDSSFGQHDFYGVSFVGKYRFSPQSSIILDFDYLLNVSGIEEASKPKPNLGLGYEVSTGSHQFQIFVCTPTAIIHQDERVFNQNDFADGDIVLGFNITRVWGFK